ncbi:Hypothetical protein CINCED_3A024055 [Cinara cedri]|uniref:Uncharacterized protein n=1 Tax=Cinara cedri TaxID=506608 RepID=A0A5E4NSD0_9HEMI|nr:Hypothetical protein CINCED_3A024055 [Cinara cedri]
MDVSYIFSCALLVASVSSSTITPPDILWLDENEVCKRSVHSGKTYVCKVLSDCKTAIDDIRDNVKYPTICLIKGNMPVVCCAPETVSRNERLGKDDEKKPIDSPEITLHFENDKDGLVQDNLITFSRPRSKLSWRSLNQPNTNKNRNEPLSIISV